MAYENLAYITLGLVENSQQVRVESEQPDDTTVLVYCFYELLGTGTLLNKKVDVDLSRPLNRLDILCAYVGDFGEKAGPPMVVSLTEDRFTGWQLPATVNGDTYAEWLAADGAQIPAVYAPDIANATTQYLNFRQIKGRIAANILLRAQYDVAGLPQVLVSVLAVTGITGNALFSFDELEADNENTRLYTVGGPRKVRVIDSADTSKFEEIDFEIVLPSEIVAPPVTPNAHILTVGYVPDGNLAFVNIVADALCEISIDGLSAFENTGTQWAPCSARRYWDDLVEQYALVSGIPSGNKTLRVRLIDDPSQEVTVSIHI